jgi:hypothetical protein
MAQLTVYRQLAAFGHAQMESRLIEMHSSRIL